MQPISSMNLLLHRCRLICKNVYIECMSIGYWENFGDGCDITELKVAAKNNRGLYLKCCSNWNTFIIIRKSSVDISDIYGILNHLWKLGSISQYNGYNTLRSKLLFHWELEFYVVLHKTPKYLHYYYLKTHFILT